MTILLFIVANFIELKISGKGTNIILMGNDGFHRTVTDFVIRTGCDKPIRNAYWNTPMLGLLE